MATPVRKHPICLSIGLLACNEQDTLRATLEALFRQSIFEKMWSRHEQCEVVVVVANPEASRGTAQTVATAQEVFDRVARSHEWAEAITARVVELPEAGKANAWNRFVHEFSSLEARFLCLLQVGIAFHQRHTISSLIAALERRAYANVASGRVCRHLLFKPQRSLRDHISLAATELFGPGRGRIGAQLYCIRAAVARRIVLPRALAAEETLIRELVCTESLTRRADPARLTFVPEAVHMVEDPPSVRAGLEQQRRDLVAQAAVHALVDYLQSRPLAERRNLVETIRQLEACDSEWLNKLVSQSQRGRRFWGLFPGSLTFRLRRLRHSPSLRKLAWLPVAFADFGLTLLASWRAHALLRTGMTAEFPNTTRPANVPVHQLGSK